MIFPEFLSAMTTTLFAQAEGPPAGSAAGSIFPIMLMFFMVLVAMYLLIVLPKQRQNKQVQQLLDSLKKNDKVLLYCGLIGTIFSINKEDGEVILKVDESNNTKLKFSLNAIYMVFPEKDKGEN